MSDKPVIITVAPLGAGTTKSQTPHVPITPEEVASDAVACCQAGASIIHIHVRDDEGRGTMEKERFITMVNTVRAALDKEGLDMVINLTTAGARSDAGFSDEDRMASLPVLKPEICSYDCGSMNWGNNRVMLNSPQFLEKLGKLTLEYNIKPEVEIFDGGMMGNAAYYVKNGFLKNPVHYQFILGAPGGLDGTVKNLVFLREMMPEGSTWSVSGIGKAHMPTMLAGLALGTDGIRVGLEDNIMFAKGVLATNKQLVERAVEFSHLSGRGVATAQQAREILGLTKKV